MIISNNASQLALQIENGSTSVGGILEQFTPSSPVTSIQTWNVTTSTSAPVYGNAFIGTYRITSPSSPGKVMQVEAQSGSANAYIVIGNATTATTQEWSLVPVSASSTSVGPYKLVNRLSGLCLTVQGQNISDGTLSPARSIRRSGSPKNGILEG